MWYVMETRMALRDWLWFRKAVSPVMSWGFADSEMTLATAAGWEAQIKLLLKPRGGGPGGAQAPRLFFLGGGPAKAGTFRVFPMCLYQIGPKNFRLRRPFRPFWDPGSAGNQPPKFPPWGVPKLKRSLAQIDQGKHICRLQILQRKFGVFFFQVHKDNGDVGTEKFKKKIIIKKWRQRCQGKL